MSRLWSVVTFGRCVWARKSRDIQLATFRRHTPATCGCWDRGRLFSLYRILCWCPGYFVSLAMGCVVVTEPFDLTSLVEDTCSPFQIGCKPILAASASQHGWAHYSLVVAKGMLVGTMHGFADTVRFRGRGLIVDRAITTGHNRMIRGGAVFLNLIFALSICARDANVVRYAKGHVYSKITPHTLQTTLLHGCFQEAYSAWTGLDAPSSCLNIAVSVVSRWRSNDIHCS